LDKIKGYLTISKDFIIEYQKISKNLPEIMDGLPDVGAQISRFLRDIEGSNFLTHPV